MANVITYGTFDLFHVGHLRLLQRAKELAGPGGSLTVVVSTDKFNWEEKQKRCAIPDAQRMEIVSALRCVDKVIPETCWEQKRKDIVENKIDIFVMGDDWQGKFDSLSDLCKVVYLPRTPGVSSTDLKVSCKNGDLTYSAYKKPLLLRIKDAVRKHLKSSPVIGKAIYPMLQKIWRGYAIPRRCRRLQKEGAGALARLHRLMLDHGIQYYCDYGTLIGFVRDGGFIRHDDDIDISIRPGTSRPADVLKVFMDASYGFVHAFDYDGRLMEFTVADSSGITIDVFFPVDIGGGMVHGYQPIWEPSRQYPNERANTVVEYDFKEATGIKSINVLGAVALVPGNFDEVLTSEYGPWRIPDAKFNTVTDRIHRELPGFAFSVTKDEALSL